MSEFQPNAQAVQDLETHATERLRAARELFKLEFYADNVTPAYYADSRRPWVCNSRSSC